MGDVSRTETTGGFTPDQERKIGESALGPNQRKSSLWRRIKTALGITAAVGVTAVALNDPLSIPVSHDSTPTPTKSPGLVTPGPTRTLTPKDQAIVNGIQESADRQNRAVATAMEEKRQKLLHSADAETPAPATSVTPTGPSGGR